MNSASNPSGWAVNPPLGLSTDKPAGRAAEALLPNHGFSDRIEFRYVSVEYLETLTAAEFQ
jgi:hypothetical protein